MPHYKDQENKLHWIDSEEHVSYLPVGSVKITDEEVAEIRTNQQETIQNTLTYAQNRASEYPPITDYLDGIVKGDQTQIDKYIADCLAVKTKYPKG